MKNFVNLTPHAIVLNNGQTIPASGVVARVKQTTTDFDADGVAVATWGEIENLPQPNEGTIYIVSGLVASAAHGRTDVVSPATNHPQTKRDENGHILSVPGFIRTE